MKRKIMIVAVFALAFFVIVWLSLWAFSDNKTIVTTQYTIKQDEIPEAFSGFRIAQIADLHNTELGENNQDLLSALKEAKPDMIVFTGDLVDSRRTDLDVAVAFAEDAITIAECYYVRGNHEASTPLFYELEARLEALGVVVLANNWSVLYRGGSSITIMGLNDPTLDSDYLTLGTDGVNENALKRLVDGIDTYSILLAHHPEWLSLYAKYQVDLVLSGHAHGGQIRFNDDTGLIAPNQGFFPKYTSGIFTQDKTTLIVSRGLGNSLFPFRINNPPELVIVDLVH